MATDSLSINGLIAWGEVSSRIHCGVITTVREVQSFLEEFFTRTTITPVEWAAIIDLSEEAFAKTAA